jgi:hypothetical protein
MQASIFLLPRIQVEYGHVPEDEYRQWNIKCLRSDFKTCEKWSKDLCAMKAVTAAAEDAGREEIMGYAIWGWSERVSYAKFWALFFRFSLSLLRRGL